MRKSNILLLIVLFLAIGGGIFYIFTSEGKNVGQSLNTDSEPAATATAAPSATPTAASTEAPTATPVVTAEPTSVPTSVPTATAVPAPTATPFADHTASGSFRSNTGAWIDVVANWETVLEDGQPRLKIDAYIESYALYFTSYTPENVVFTVDGNTYRANHDPISVSDNGKTQTLLATQIVDIPTGCDLKVEVTWFCNGLTYGNKQFESITAKDTIHIP